MDEIERIAKKYGLRVVYDAAHAFAVKYKGVSVANFGDASMFSFHATKVFNTIEGGAVCFRNDQWIQLLNDMKNFGIRSEEEVAYVGGNAKMNEFQAAMGLCNMKHLDEEILKRKVVVERYREKLNDIEAVSYTHLDVYKRQLLNLMITHISFLNKYASKYISINSFGVGQLIYHLPLILGIYYLWKYRYKFKGIDDKLYSIGIMLMPFSLFFGCMGYKYEVIGRTFVFFLFDWIIFLPALLKGKTVFKMNQSTRLIIKLIVFVYFLIRFWLYISIQNAGLETFSFIWF